MTIQEMEKQFTDAVGLPPISVELRDKLLAGVVASGIPYRLMIGVGRYITKGIRPGDFLYAVLCNNLKQSILRADKDSFIALPDLVKWLHWEAPSESYGSEEKVHAWIGRFKNQEEE